MSLFGRLVSVFHARANEMVDQLEDPAATIKDTIRSIEDQAPAIKEGLAAEVASFNKLITQKSQLEDQIAQADANIKRAVAKQNDEIAKIYVSQKLELQKQLDHVNRELVTATAKADQAKKQYHQWQSKLEDLHARAAEKLADHDRAEFTRRYNQAKTSIDTSAFDSKLAEAFRKIDNEAAVEDAKAELDVDPSATKLADFEAQSHEDAVEAELAKYKTPQPAAAN